MKSLIFSIILMAAFMLPYKVNAMTSEEIQVVTEPYVWKNVEIVGGGFVTGLIFSPKQKDLIYSRTDIGGAYRWNQDTKHWIPLIDQMDAEDWNLMGVESIAADPVDGNRVYLAVGTYTRSWASNGAILSSTDQGQTWKRTDMPFKMGGNENGRSIGERLAIDPNKNSILYFGSRSDGLWRSVDYGATWNRVNTFPTTGTDNGVGIGFILFDKSSGTFQKPTLNIYVGVAAPGTNLYHSSDGGNTWAPVLGQAKGNGFIPHRGVLTSDGMLYLTYGNGYGPNGITNGAVWKYDTKNNIWTDITPVVPDSTDEKAGIFGYAGLTVNASNPKVIIVSTLDRWSPGDDIFRSSDGGITWKGIRAKSVRDSSVSPYLNWGRESAEFGHWIGDVEIDPFNSDRVLYVTGATIWGCENITDVDSGDTIYWKVYAQGLEETAVLDLISPSSGAHLISALGDLGGFVHDDLTVSPRKGLISNPILTTGTGLDFAEKTPSIIVRVGNVRGESKEHGAYSLDGGRTWTPFESEPEKTRGGGRIAVSADGSTFVWSIGRAIPHYSHDRGKTWIQCNGIKENISVISDRFNPNKFYGINSYTGELYVSTDKGINFSVTETGILTELQERGRLYAAPSKESDLWLAIGKKGLYRSENSGIDFSKLNNVQEAYAIGFGKSAPNQNFPAIYMSGKIGNVRGVFRSDNGGNNWVRINDDQHQYGWTGQIIIGDPRIYGRVYIGTNGRGILYADPIK